MAPHGSSLCAASPRASSTSAMAQGNGGGAPTPLPQLSAWATLHLPQRQATATSTADPTLNQPTSIDDGAGGISSFTPTPSASPTVVGSSSDIGNKRGRKITSDVCNDFEQLYKQVNGKKVRYAAKCHYCKSQLTAKGGTGHLHRHRIACASKAERASRPQSLLQFNGDGSVRSWDYNDATARSY